MPVFRSGGDVEAVGMLEKVPIFAGFSERQLRALAKDAAERSFAEGATVVRQGEKGIAFFLLLDGEVEVRRKDRKLAKLGPGDFFGEMALFHDTPRSADVVATRPTRCLVLSKWEFWGHAMDEPKVLRALIEEMARRLSETDRALSE